MKTIEIFDPAMCCSTGVCGPSVDKELLRIATVIDALKQMGVTVVRHNLSSEPQAFIRNETVNALLRSEGAEVLPVTMVDGTVAVKGKYPSTAQMGEWTGKDLRMIPVPQTGGTGGADEPEGCCCDGGGEDHDCCCKGEECSCEEDGRNGGCCCGQKVDCHKA